MSLNSEQKLAIGLLRSLCTSSTEPLTIHRLFKDYEEMEGQKLDYTGFHSPLEMLRSSNEFYIGTNQEGRMFVTAKASKESSHILELKRTEKRKKPKSKQSQLNYPSRMQRYNPQPQGSGLWGQGKKRAPGQHPASVHATRALRSANNNVPQAFNRNQVTLKYQQPKSGYQPQFAPVPLPQSKPPVKLLPSSTAKVYAQPLPPSQNKPILKSQCARIVYPEPAIQNLTITTPSTAPILPVQQATQRPQFYTPPAQSKNVPLTYVDPAIQRPQIVYQQDFEDQIPINEIEICTNDSLFGNNLEKTHGLQANQKIGTKTTTTSKPSVQNRINQIKKVVPNKDNQDDSMNQGQFNRSTSTESQPKSTLDVLNVPLEWWESCTLNVVDKLEQYCKIKQIPTPEYSFYKIKEGKKFKFQCRVSVQDATYSTYPEDFDTMEQAKIVCASNAINEIRSKNLTEKYPEFEGEEDELAIKLYECIRNHQTGVFLTSIPNVFLTEYSVTIPGNFVNILEFSHKNLFRIEKNSTFQDIVFAVEDASLPRIDSLSSFSDELDPNALPAQIPRLPWEESAWNVVCTYPESTQQLWCTLIGPEYHEKRLDLYNEIELSDINDRPASIAIGQHYIAIVHKCPYRVRALNTDPETNKVSCFFIDTGEEEWLQEDQLYTCEDRFLQLPAQAIAFTLQGLELFSSIDNIQYFLSDLQDGVFIAKIITTEEEFMNKEPLRIVLYDTSTDDDVDMNEVLLEKIKSKLPPPKLDLTKINDIVITGILDDGLITCYIKDSPFFELIKYGIQEMTMFGEVLAAQKGFYLKESDDLYLVYDEIIKHYVRAKIVGIDNQNTENVIVELVDHGPCRQVNKKKIIKLLPFGMSLNAIPPQALKIQLHDVNTKNTYVVSLLRGLLKPGTSCIVRYKTQVNGVSSVTMFQRNHGHLQVINETIKTQLKQMRPESPENSTQSSESESTTSPLFLAKPIQSLQDGCQPLQKIKVPGNGQHFGVKVIVTQSPKMFYVQPETFSKQFNKMMSDLQKYCQKSTETLTADQLQTGMEYAAYREQNNTWCRVKLLDSFDQDYNKVYFSDYGCIDVIGVKNIKRLPTEFRTLPEQAILAKLYGIQPNSTSTYSSPATLRFIELTKDKQFDSIVMGIETQEGTGDRIVVLELIDQSASCKDDILISHILINESLAVRATE